MTPAPPQGSAPASRNRILSDQIYKTQEPVTPYERERCRLDLYVPGKAQGFATLVWFHGGGLTGGKRTDAGIGPALSDDGIAVVTPNYRLYPKAKFPDFLEDGAAAYAWTLAQIGRYGGALNRVYIGGHSAGAYIALMLAMDPRYLRAVGHDANRVAGFISLSSQTVTHYTVRAERRYPPKAVVSDDAAPLYYCRPDTAPILALYASSDMAGRADENRLFASAMKSAGSRRLRCSEVWGRTHASIAEKIKEPGDAVRRMILEFMR